MSIAVLLPEIGESITEGTIARWLVQQGDHVEIDQPLVEITTDKVDAELPSPATGVIEKLLVAEGDTVAVGAQLAMIDPVVTGVPVPGTEAGDSQVATAGPADEVASVDASAPLESAPRVTPVAKRIADEAHVDLQRVEGSGAAGRITKSDVLRHTGGEADRGAAPRNVIAATPAPPERTFASRFDYALAPGDRVIPMTPQRKLIAEHMVYSKHTSPHVGTVAEVDLGAVA